MGGGLIGEEERWVEREGSSDRDTLLFTAGQVPGPVAHPVVEVDHLEQLDRSLFGLPARPSRGSERKRDVLFGGEAGDEIERLEHETDAGAAVLGECPARQSRDVDVTEGDRPTGRGEDPAET